MTVIHGVGLNELQLQPDAVVTLSVPVAPALGTETVIGETLYEHATAACETVTVCPAIVSAPLRAPPVLAATV